MAEVLDQLKFLMRLGRGGDMRPSSKPMPKADPVPAPNPNITKLNITKGYQSLFGKSAGLAPGTEKPYVKPEKWISAGGVVVAGKNDFSKIYIRKPSNNFGPWSFAKGKIEKGESPPKAALREVEEEMGIQCALVPGGYLGTGEGGYSITHYYLMYATRDTGRTDKETEEVRLVTWDEALHTLARAGNARDVKITARALDLVEKLRKQGKVP